MLQHSFDMKTSFVQDTGAGKNAIANTLSAAGRRQSSRILKKATCKWVEGGHYWSFAGVRLDPTKVGGTVWLVNSPTLKIQVHTHYLQRWGHE